MGTAESKQYLPLGNKPVLIHTLEVFQAVEEIGDITLVVGEKDIPRCRQYKDQYGLHKIRAILAGGKDRQQSVYEGIRSLPPDTEWVLVHDGVRPFVTAEHILACWRGAMKHGAAVLAVPAKDTIKLASDTRQVTSTPDRRSLWAVQTPQAFRLSLLLEAHERAAADGFTGTDDAMLVERLGQAVYIVEGDYRNIKLTTPEDLQWANWLLEKEEGKSQMIRIGHGFDVHQLVPGRPCIIGGVTIPFEKGLLGHSDADVLLHAVCDAVLGALGQGDIGKHFPDTDIKYKDADSLELLKEVWKLARQSGYRLGNLDGTIMAQKPKMSPFIPAMVSRIASALEEPESLINIKATTTEQLGFIGRGEGIAAQAVVCLQKAVL